jgi:transposase
MRKFTINQFNEMFPDEDACLDFLKDTLYPDGVTCRKCGRITQHHRLTKRRAYSCQECGTHVYPLAGTIFAKSRTPLKLWFYGMFLMASTRCGISAAQLQRELGVTYKTAWRMFKQLRSLLAEDEEELVGTVEIDEAYWGGKDKWRHRRDRGGRGNRDTKTPILGMAQRAGAGEPGKVIVRVVPNVTYKTVLPNLTKKVLPRSTVYTDEGPVYGALESYGYKHSRVNHSQDVYVAGDVHVNTIEGFWSLIRRGIGGVNHSVSTKYLQDYLNEYAFRYNHREDEAPMFAIMGKEVPTVRYGQFGKYQPVGERSNG